MDKKQHKIQPSSTTHFPPVVAVLGHVDHGKTTLLDAIRKTSLAAREKGGITQTIGASSVELMHEGKKSSITFIDTPGHEAFTQMRGRGAQAADIALLIVSAVDGVKPQTKESISVLKESLTPFIVVLTKADLPTKNSEKVKQELLKEGITLEGYGGDTPVIEISAKTNLNIKELLDLILLMFDMHKSANYTKEVSSMLPLKAIVIESKLDNKSGPKATAVIKNGSLSVREELQIDDQVFKVRALLDSQGKQLKSATVGEAVEILGFAQVPAVGGIVMHKVDTALVSASSSLPAMPLQKELVYRKQEKEVGLAVVLVADTQGSLEAIINALPKEIKLVTQKTGEVSEADILLAKSIEGIVLSFNTKIKPNVAQFALTEKVLLRNYEIIYELLDEITDALEGKMLSQMEQIFGRAKVLAKFPFEKGFAYCISVIEGRVARGDHVRVLRDEEVLGECLMSSLRTGKNPISKVEKGHEAGIVLTNTLDIQVGDMLISHS